ncbi:diguanylate cyclase (GGDEF) domain protein [Peptostreptococcaceae bacterium AS15]|nr:diguanylate cyclase (GGDEF) domain protein [Peptostreptococcaceae bacterium AS15]
MNISFKNILNYIYGIAIIVTVVVMVSSPSVRTSNTIDFQKPVELSSAFIRYTDKSDKCMKNLTHSLPYGIKTDDSFCVIVNLEDFDNLENKSFNILSSYTDFECYMDGKMFYSNYTSNSPLLYSSGTLVNYVIDFPKNIKNKVLTIRYIPTLKYNKNTLIHPISVGYRTNFFTPILIKDELISIAISLFLVFVFFISVILALFFAKKNVSKSITLNIGLLSLLFALYSFSCYHSVLYFFSKYRFIIYYMEYISLLLIPLPIINLIQNYSDTRYKFLLFFLKNTILINCLNQIFLTSNKIIEFKDMLPFSTILIIISCLVPLILLLISKTKIQERKSILFSLVPVLVILIIGIGAYNFLGLFEISSLVLLMAMMFILIQMTNLISTYANVMQENEKTERYKSLVNYDALTLMGSRHSFEEHIANLRHSPRNTAFISADLNNLKLINDNLGHNYGDVAIIEAGKFLQENFKDSKIYRIGGDEYVVIYDGIVEQSYIDCVREKKIYIKDISEKIDVTVSIGYFNYYVNNAENYSIDDALRFSDIRMYENKRSFKKKISL